MQTFQNIRQDNEQRFSLIDQRWSIVEDALMIEKAERKEDITSIKQKLNQHIDYSQTIQRKKAKIMHQRIKELTEEAELCKQNIEESFEFEAKFRMNHLTEKNNFIHSFNESGETFNNNLQSYSKSKIDQITNRLNTIDKINEENALENVREIKDERIVQARQFLEEERKKYTEIITNINTDVTKEIDQLRGIMRKYSKNREQSNSKIQIMINALGVELTQLEKQEWKQGELTYDCLLKLLEDSCAKIQQAQLR